MIDVNKLSADQLSKLEQLGQKTYESIDRLKRLSQMTNEQLADMLELYLGELDIFSPEATLIETVADRLRGRPIGESFLDDEDNHE